MPKRRLIYNAIKCLFKNILTFTSLKIMSGSLKMSSRKTYINLCIEISPACVPCLSYLCIPTYVISAQSERLFSCWIRSQYALSARSLSNAYNVNSGGKSLGKSRGCISMLLVKLSSVP